MSVASLHLMPPVFSTLIFVEFLHTWPHLFLLLPNLHGGRLMRLMPKLFLRCGRSQTLFLRQRLAKSNLMFWHCTKSLLPFLLPCHAESLYPFLFHCCTKSVHKCSNYACCMAAIGPSPNHRWTAT